MSAPVATLLDELSAAAATGAAGPSTPADPIMKVRLSKTDRALIAEVQRGLPMVSRPYAAVGSRLGLTETVVIERLRALLDQGVIKRLGVVVRHHELGFRANAMVVWDAPDDQVAALGRCLGGFDFITLCYRRPRRPPDWPYNLFCMIHGRDRDEVLAHLDFLIAHCSLQAIPHDVLFSKRRFKQRGAVYA
jgi:DNA-binding Lrp family transcriptional regulator